MASVLSAATTRRGPRIGHMIPWSADRAQTPRFHSHGQSHCVRSLSSPDSSNSAQSLHPAGELGRRFVGRPPSHGVALGGRDRTGLPADCYDGLVCTSLRECSWESSLVGDVDVDLDGSLHKALVGVTEHGAAHAVCDIGCTKSVAGAVWCAEAAARMRQYGLRPLMCEDDTRFRGLGDSSRRAHRGWRMPCGIKGRHTVTRGCEIDGSMVMLVSVGQLDEWGAKMNIRANIHDVALPRSDNGHFLVDLCKYDDDPTADPLFREFVIPTESDVAYTAEEHCY